MGGAVERRRAIVSASLGTGFPALGIHVSGEVVMLGGLALTGFTVDGAIRKAQAEARRFNTLALQAR